MSFDYYQSVIGKMRKGTVDDSFIDVNETLQVVNSKVVLSEIPDKFNGLVVKTVFGNTTLVEIKKGTPAENQYLCDYNLGVVHFPETVNNERYVFSYKGRGSVYLAAERIYTKQMNSNEIIQTLRDILDEADSIINLSERFTNKGTYSSSTVYYGRNIVTYDNAAYMCINNSADGIINIPPTNTTHWMQMVSVKQAIEAANSAATSANTAATNANTATTNANNAADYANEQGDYAKSIRDNFGHKGDYSPTATYKNGNVVTYGGINYFCIQDTTAGIDPLNGAYWTVVSPQASINDETWTATEGQVVFSITNGNYVPDQGNIEVWVGGVPQVSGVGYTETNNTTITLSEGVTAGTTVFAKWYEGHMSISKGHKSSHALGGQDEIDLTQMRNYKEKVSDEFDRVDVQLAEKATKLEIANIGNASPKGTYATLAALQTAFPSGATGIYVVTADGKWYYWSESAWVSGGTYQSTGIAEKTITSSKTDFLIPSPNLFDKTTAVLNKYVAYNNGVLADASTNDTSDFIAIEPSTYYVKNSTGQIAFYDSNKVYISGIQENTAIAGANFQTPSNAMFLRFSIKKSLGYSIETTQLEKGQTTTTYTPFGLSYVDSKKLDIKKGFIVKPNDTNFLLPSRNLFDKIKATLNKYIDPNNGNAIDASTADISDYIPVEPSTNYIKNVKGHVAFYNSGKGYISGVNESTALANVSFQSPANASYVRFSIKKSEGYNIDEAQFEKGQIPTSYVSSSVYSLDPTKVEVSSVEKRGKYVGMEMNFLGDSIMAAGNYQTLLKAELGLSLTRNYGVGGTTLVGNGSNGFLDRYSAMDNNADVIFVQGGTNDFSQDITMDKFKTDLRSLIEGLCQKFHGKIIIFATLPPRYIKYLGANLAGLTTLDYANATKELCAEYSIPVVDLHNESGINRFNMDLYMPDMVHPNDAGYVKLTNLIISKMNQL